MARQGIAERGERISAEEQKQILISILDEIAAYCDGNGLTYFLVGGTQANAVVISSILRGMTTSISECRGKTMKN